MDALKYRSNQAIEVKIYMSSAGVLLMVNAEKSRD